MTKQTTLTLLTPEIFSWQAILDYLGRETNEVMYTIIGSKVRRAFKIDKDVYLCDICYNQMTHQIDVTILNEKQWTEMSTKEISTFIEDWFDLKTQLSPFYQLASSDTILCNLVTQFHGLRLVGVPDFYEAVTWGILGQQINLAYAYLLKKRFVETFGESLNFEDKTYWVYPSPESIAELSVEELLKLRLTRRKAEYLIGISKKMAKGDLSKAFYQQFENAPIAEKEMIKIRGIGPWTANYVLMRCLRMGDAFLTSDIGLLNGIKTLEQLKTKPNIKRLNQLQEQWGLWSSYATFYIWRVLY